jgi:hypothetical protein
MLWDWRIDTDLCKTIREGNPTRYSYLWSQDGIAPWVSPTWPRATYDFFVKTYKRQHIVQKSKNQIRLYPSELIRTWKTNLHGKEFYKITKHQGQDPGMHRTRTLGSQVPSTL